MDERLAKAVDVLAGFVNHGGDLEETLEELLLLGSATVGSSLASLTIRDQHGKPTTAALTSPLALPLDEVQYDNNDGPCLDAARLQTVFRVDDTEAEVRWPEFTSFAAQRGVCSSLSVPLVVGASSVGSANFYEPALGWFTPQRVRSAEVVANHCAIAAQYWTVAKEATNLAAAMQSRSTIEQAKGVIMATTGCSPDDAFDLLRQQSQAENRKLRDIAAEVIARQKR
jgi:GAF domain-containing protein